MNEFVVKMADERGRIQQQVLPAATAEELHARFTQAGYYVYSVKMKGIAGVSGRRKVKLEQFLIFNQQFVTLIRAGLPIHGSVELLSRRQKDQRLKAQLMDVAQRVKTGQSLSEAFEAQGGFPGVYTTTLLAGERSGNLVEVLQRYLEFQRISLTFRKKLRASMVYPALLITLVIGLFIFLITFVVPRFSQLYDQLNVPLPWMTQFLLQIGNVAQHYGAYIGVVVLVCAIFLIRWARTDAGAFALDKLRLKLPLAGAVWQKYQVALFSRTLSTLLTGGLPLVPALETAAKSIGSRQLSAAVYSSVTSVREGKSLATSIESTRVFPELAIEMVEVGEGTGALPQMLNSVAGFFEEDVENSMTAAMSLIEPIILIFMGVVVGIILVALYLPILQLGAGSFNH